MVKKKTVQTYQPINKPERQVSPLALKQSALSWMNPRPLGGRILASMVCLGVLVMPTLALASRSESNTLQVVNQLARQFTLRTTVNQVNQGLQGFVNEVSGKLRAPAMAAAASNFPSDMGTVPAGLGVPIRDGAGRPLGYCAWDNNAAVNTASYLGGSALGTQIVYAVLSPGLDGVVDTSCADVASSLAASGDDYLEIRYPQNVSSQQFKTSISTVAALATTAGNEGDVRLVLENNKFYTYSGGAWIEVSSGGVGTFSDDSATNGASAIAYTTGKVTVAEFAATAATFSGNISVTGTSLLTGAVTASNGLTVSTGGINVTGASSITGNTTITGALTVSSGATITGTVAATTFSGSGASLTDLNASSINSGVLNVTNGGTGVNASAAANGALLIGTGSGFALGSLMGTSNQVTVVNSSGGIQLSLPQSIATTSTPTFGGLTLNGALSGTTATYSGALTALRLGLADSTGGVSNPNVVVGSGAMAAAASGDGANTAIGFNTLAANTSGHFNTALGYRALTNSTTGQRLVAVGYQALLSNTTGNGNIAMGDGALQFNTTASDNIAIGQGAMFGNGTNGRSNVAVGKDALFSNNGTDNVAIGQAALRNNTSGEQNIGIGLDALNSNTSGNSNTAIGFRASQLNTTATDNVAVGKEALYNTTTGGKNSALGVGSLRANTVGVENAGLGAFALDSLATGNNNLGLGTEAGSRSVSMVLTGGSNNSFLGGYSGPTSGVSTLNYATAIGAYAEVSTDNTVVLGRTTDKTVIGATGDDGSGNILQVTGSVKATAFNTSSDRRLKTDINQLDDGLLNKLSGMGAYSYRFIADRNGTMRYGVIAQEIAPLFPFAVSYDARGIMAVDYGALGAIAAAGVGKLNTRLEALKTTVNVQAEKLTALEKDMLKVDDRVKSLEAWKTDTAMRMDTMQTAIDLNIEKIAEHALKIASNTEKITSLEQVTQNHSSRLATAEGSLESLKQQWGSSFAKSEDGSTLTVLTPNLVASNFSAEQVRTRSAYTERLEAEMARIATLEVDNLRANTATTGSLRATELNTGSVEVFASTGSPALLFTTAANGHYTVNVNAGDGSYVTASVMVSGGVARVVTVANDGINLTAEGTMIKAVANGKLVKASWIKMG